MSRSSYSPASVWLIPPRVLHSDMPGPAWKISPQRDRRRHSLRQLLLSELNRRPRSRWKRRETAMTLRSRAKTLLRKTDEPAVQYKVCLLTGTRYMKKRWAMGAGSGAGTPRRKPVGFLVAVKLFYISLKKLPQFHFDPVIVWSLIAAKPSSISPCCEASGVPVPEYLPHRKATTGYT